MANFFPLKYRHVGCPERCHVMPGLSATFSNGRDPLRGSKRRKSHFYGHYGPQIPIFGTSFSANFFFSSKYGHVGCPERCHVIPGLSATFSNAREPTQRLKTAKKSFLRSFWTLNPNFLAIMSHQGGITCGAIDEPRKSSKAIDERVIINFRDKNVVIARFRDKNVYR